MTVKDLEVVGALPVVHDPYISACEGIRMVEDLDKALRDSDCLILVTAHDTYKKLDLDHIKKLIRTPVQWMEGTSLIRKSIKRKDSSIGVLVSKGVDAVCQR